MSGVMKEITNRVLYKENGDPLYKNHNWVLRNTKDTVYFKTYGCTKCNGILAFEAKRDWIYRKTSTIIQTDVADMNCEDVLVKDIIE